LGAWFLFLIFVMKFLLLDWGLRHQ
jgi:hypothetical protein